MTPLNDFTPFGLFLLGEEPTIEDFILLIGTIVAFIAFVLWCCFPIQPKENLGHQPFSCKSLQHSISSLQHTQQHLMGNHCNGKNANGSSTYGLKSDNSSAHITYHCCNSNTN